MTARTPPSLDKSAPLSAQRGPLRPVGHLAKALGMKVLLGALVLLLVFLFVWYATPYYLRDYLNKRGSELPDYTCRIEWIRIHPLTAGIDVDGIHLTKKSGRIPVPFLESPRFHIALQWSQLLHGSFRSNLHLVSPVINFVQGPTEDQTQTFLEPEWVTAVKQLVPLEINRFEVTDGDIHFYDFHADPKINLQMNNVHLTMDNLSNSNHSTALMPTTVVLTGTPFKVGVLDAQLAVNTDLKQPTFSEKLKMDRVPAPALNAFLAKYGSVYAKSGELAFYTEMVSEKGSYDGYVKPYFQDLVFEPMPKDRAGLGAIWASIVNVMKDLLENDKDVVATRVPISGTYKDPNVDFWAAAFGLIRNAYMEALAKRFDQPEIAPAPAQTAPKT